MRAHSYLKIFNKLHIKVALLQPKKSKGRLLSNMAAETCLLLVMIQPITVIIELVLNLLLHLVISGKFRFISNILVSNKTMI